MVPRGGATTRGWLVGSWSAKLPSRLSGPRIRDVLFIVPGERGGAGGHTKPQWKGREEGGDKKVGRPQFRQALLSNSLGNGTKGRGRRRSLRSKKLCSTHCTDLPFLFVTTAMDLFLIRLLQPALSDGPGEWYSGCLALLLDGGRPVGLTCQLSSPPPRPPPLLVPPLVIVKAVVVAGANDQKCRHFPRRPPSSPSLRWP